MTADNVHIGVDLGTSSLKVVAIGPDGAVCAAARRDYPTRRPEPLAAEQDPQDWWNALAATLSEVAAAVDPVRWSGIGLSAMLPTLVALDAAGFPTGPAITWEDGRAEAEAISLRQMLGDERMYQITGQRVDARYLAPMHMRLQRLGRGGVVVAAAKDVLFAQLTGELLTDPSTAAGTGVFNLDELYWDTELVAASGIPGLPPVAPAATSAPLLPHWRSALGLTTDVPVVLGAADSVLGAVGIGAHAHGDVAVIAGTSAVVLGISDTAVLDRESRYLITPLAGPGWGLEMDVLAVGSAFREIARLLGLPGPAELLAAAATVPPGQAPIFLPYLTPGEQGALWNPDLTGTLHGLDMSMGAGHVGRALLTGVVVELRRAIAIAEAATGRRGPVLLGGGAAISPLLWQDLADATGREVLVDRASRDHSAVGAALFAADSLCREISHMPNLHRVEPKAELADWWAQMTARHDALRHAIEGIDL
ncbi:MULTISPECIES: FGGY-family carbohydrate kinase [unclassified Mycolicibacterium]|uniref:xylulokinase n=1 Tax=unclassified Mycolicibacterium TaxID=2636767 RepID=UPI0012DF3339|nr:MULTISPECIES: FGGY-family carbohydrate kinase [unclassified Mycolicibacterium]MUL80641.1 FGGY-family carbohydrate kinase [Mycolicibacterium sp. CBMA 329]MUL86408.1 FGGY-family carbohydrate kinase [Mycolicibacterium sp. CBMA 331]MUM01270.1 FGGY-family carbohydrate kinase [Mycolicibacterium sp. CBMA 334]MUM27702.1 FGGY-family carbohydrate kinase [Mycolicibacterium sp. CBMA 295]MUM36704.1 FGGY-family carbohydrate kinase [Mycolicibacterium sp. CBMA 247]